MNRQSSNESATPRLDTKTLSNFIYQMNIVRRQVSAYPVGHQVILTAADRTLKVLKNLKTSTQQITIGIARDRLMLGAVPLDPKNPVYREYARSLFSHGIVALTIHHGLTTQELSSFCRIIASNPEEVLAQGGIVTVITAAGIVHAKVTPLAHHQFNTEHMSPRPETSHITQTDTSKAWDRFVGKLLVSTDIRPTEAIATPERLAGILSTHQSDVSSINTGRYDKAIISFLRDLDRENLPQQHDALLEKYRIFVSELQPELRQQFLSCTVSALAMHESQAGAILSRIPNAVLMDTLSDLNSRQATIPPFILQMLSQLSCDDSPPAVRLQKKQPDCPEPYTSEQVNQIFAEHRAEKYVPDDYQSLLRSFPNHQHVPVLPSEVIQQLTESIHDQSMESRLCSIINHMLQHSDHSQEQTALKNHLLPLVQHFIATGDFTALIDLHKKTIALASKTKGVTTDHLTSVFSSYSFTRQIIRSLPSWTPAKCQDIFDLMLQVGAPFIPQLLDLLGEEKDRSMRSRYLTLLGDMGPIIRQDVLSRLHDERWYLVRNLIVLLRGLKDPDLMDAVEPLLQHPHERVRQEALKTAFYFKDARADAGILRELERSMELPPVWAVSLARHSQGPKVFQRLIELLCQSSLSKESLSIRLAVVTTLADMGNPIALHALERTLFSFSICHPRRHKRLQAHILSSLKKYPRQTTELLYRRLDRSMRPDLAELRHLSAPGKTGTVS